MIRPGLPHDVDAVLEFWRRAEAASSSTQEPKDVLGLLERDPEALLLAEEEGEIVGSLVAGWDGWRGTFYASRSTPPTVAGGWR